MSDKSWKIYTEFRTMNVQSAREGVLNWAMENAPDTMRLQQVKDLQDYVENIINGAARTSYDIGIQAAVYNQGE
jgi:hypothetical protein